MRGFVGWFKATSGALALSTKLGLPDISQEGAEVVEGSPASPAKEAVCTVEARWRKKKLGGGPATSVSRVLIPAIQSCA